MLLLDDVLLFPIRSLLWIFQEVHDAARREQAAESESIKEELRDSCMLLETGKIIEAEFEAREKVLLDRLDAIRARDGAEEEEGGLEDEEDRGSRGHGA